MIAATAAVALFAWTLVWTWGARHVAARFEAWRAAQAEAGVTVAYGIPWNAQQTAGGGGPMLAELVPLDIARPRGGGAKVQ